MEKIIHQIWVGPNAMPQREQEFVRKIQLQHPTFQHLFWHDGNIPELPDQIKAVYDYFSRNGMWAMCADILRQYVVYYYGGIYVDVDFDAVQGIESWDIENYDGFIYHGSPGDYPLPNQFFGIKQGHPLSEYLVSKITMANTHWYGPSWFGHSVKNYYALPFECNVEDLGNVLSSDNFKYIFVRDVEKFMVHYGLHSWRPENKDTYQLRSNSHPLLY